LADLEPAPQRLFLTGEIPAGVRVAVVGTRRPSPEARTFAGDLAQELSEAGIVVVSGGAEGIDTAAHAGAQRGPTPTLVVAPCSWDQPFPPANQELFREIVRDGGGYLSAYEDHVVARRHAFFLRNSVMVSICSALLLIEAPLRSGARNASCWARRLGRPLLVVPHAPWALRGAGCNAELKLGAEVCVSAKDVLRRLELSQYLTPRRTSVAAPQLALTWNAPTPTRDPNVSDVGQRIWQLLAAGPLHLDGICASLGVGPASVQQALTELQLDGWVRSNGAGYLIRSVGQGREGDVQRRFELDDSGQRE
jgi:DNA processing protein